MPTFIMRRFIEVNLILATLSLIGSNSSVFINVAFSSDFQSPRTAALGGAGHAGPVLNDAIYLNPSFTAFLQSYGLAINYIRALRPAPHPHYNLSVLDGRSELFQAGVGYTRREHNNFIHIGAAKSFVKRIGVGLGGKFGTFQDGTPLAKDMTASLTLIPIAWVQAAIIVDNILSEDVGKRLGWEREFILGTKVNLMKLILAYADPHWAPDLDEGAWGFEGGLELALFSDFFLRGGLFRSAHVPFLNGRGSGYGFGAGWMAPRLAVDYAFSSAASGVIGTSHAFGLTVYF